MKIVRALLALATLLPLLVMNGCTSGGGSPPPPAVPAWEKFRHDISNSGQGNGILADNIGGIRWQLSIDGTPISASPAIDVNGIIYIATEGGTLAAVNSNGTIRWTFGGTTPVTCSNTIIALPLGPLISSPAIYAFNSVTNVIIGSASGALYIIQDNGTTRTCSARFAPNAIDFPNASIASRFISSPSFVANNSTAALAGIFIGASIDITQSGAKRTVGKLYAINTDGSVIWQFPRVGGGEIGAVTSSPAVGNANDIYFTAADGNLYAITSAGAFKWSFPLGTVDDARAPFPASPITATQVFAASAGGEIFAVNPDGSFHWSVASPDGTGFLSSPAFGAPAVITPSTTPTVPPTPTPPPGATVTLTPTVTPGLPVSTVFGVTAGGSVVSINTTTGEMNMLSGTLRPIVGPIVSSPALSGDSYLVFGAADGSVHAINTSTGEEPPNWPVPLAKKPIRSSPAIDDNSIVYVGADDGILYAVGTQ